MNIESSSTTTLSNPNAKIMVSLIWYEMRWISCLDYSCFLALRLDILDNKTHPNYFISCLCLLVITTITCSQISSLLYTFLAFVCFLNSSSTQVPLLFFSPFLALEGDMYHDHLHPFPCLHCQPHTYIRMVLFL